MALVKIRDSVFGHCSGFCSGFFGSSLRSLLTIRPDRLFSADAPCPSPRLRRNTRRRLTVRLAGRHWNLQLADSTLHATPRMPLLPGRIVRLRPTAARSSPAGTIPPPVRDPGNTHRRAGERWHTPRGGLISRFGRTACRSQDVRPKVCQVQLNASWLTPSRYRERLHLRRPAPRGIGGPFIPRLSTGM